MACNQFCHQVPEANSIYVCVERLVIYKPPPMPEEESKEAEDEVGENDVVSGPRKNLNLQM